MDFTDDEYDDEDLPNGTVPCRNCGEQVYEDAVQCTYCGEYGPTESGGERRAYPQRSVWFWVLGILGTIAVIASLLRGVFGL
ncbi:MAG: hypothetical protein R3C18_16515 [Planctomycetaceae bacterium]